MISDLKYDLYFQGTTVVSYTKHRHSFIYHIFTYHKEFIIIYNSKFKTLSQMPAILFGQSVHNSGSRKADLGSSKSSGAHRHNSGTAANGFVGQPCNDDTKSVMIYDTHSIFVSSQQ